MIVVDGSHGEGGGQIIRTAVALSAVTKQAVKIDNIRANRPNPGLQAQHLSAVSAVAKLCGAKTDAKIGSTSVTFEPGNISGGTHEIDIGTAGAISLVLQPAILVGVNASSPVRIIIAGGTHVQWSPSIDYMRTVFAYYLQRLGLDVSIKIARHGFYPKGGGVVAVDILPQKMQPLNIVERGNIVSIDLISVASEDLKKFSVAERQARGFQEVFEPDNSMVHYAESSSPGSSIQASVQFTNCVLGASALGKRGKPAEKVGLEAAHMLKKEIDGGACIDNYMADQILPFLALSGGKIKVGEISSHAKTNMWLIEHFMAVNFTSEDGFLEVKK